MTPEQLTELRRLLAEDREHGMVLSEGQWSETTRLHVQATLPGLLDALEEAEQTANLNCADKHAALEEIDRLKASQLDALARVTQERNALKKEVKEERRAVVSFILDRVGEDPRWLFTDLARAIEFGEHRA